MEAAATFSPFSFRGDPAKAKLLVLGPAGETAAAQARSLNIEHVSPAQLVRSEISRHTSGGSSADGQAGLALVRRWFWARKPDAGFVLSDFPATLLQAKVLDEWLEARGEQLTACLVPDPAHTPDSVIEHYRTLGLDLLEAAPLLN